MVPILSSQKRRGERAGQVEETKKPSHLMVVMMVVVMIVAIAVAIAVAMVLAALFIDGDSQGSSGDEDEQG